MKVHQFVREAEAMRAGQRYPHVGVPRRVKCGQSKQYIKRKLEYAYRALWSFRAKHPDSSRTIKARQRDLERHEARQIRLK